MKGTILARDRAFTSPMYAARSVEILSKLGGISERDELMRDDLFFEDQNFLHVC